MLGSAAVNLGVSLSVAIALMAAPVSGAAMARNDYGSPARRDVAEHYQQGTAKFKAGDFAGAASEFEAALVLSADRHEIGSLLLNAGRACQAAAEVTDDIAMRERSLAAYGCVSLEGQERGFHPDDVHSASESLIALGTPPSRPCSRFKFTAPRLLRSPAITSAVAPPPPPRSSETEAQNDTEELQDGPAIDHGSPATPYVLIGVGAGVAAFGLGAVIAGSRFVPRARRAADRRDPAVLSPPCRTS